MGELRHGAAHVFGLGELSNSGLDVGAPLLELWEVEGVKVLAKAGELACLRTNKRTTPINSLATFSDVFS